MAYKFIMILTAGILLAAPVAGMAATMPGIWPGGYWAPHGLVSCTGYITTGNVTPSIRNNAPTNTCTDLNDLFQTFLNVLAFGMTLALFVMSPILFAWAGLLILMAGGHPSWLEDGKKIMTGTVIGIAIILLAYIVLKTFIDFVGILNIGGFS